MFQLKKFALPAHENDGQWRTRFWGRVASVGQIFQAELEIPHVVGGTARSETPVGSTDSLDTYKYFHVVGRVGNRVILTLCCTATVLYPFQALSEIPENAKVYF
jgi:hypothetical protein